MVNSFPSLPLNLSICTRIIKTKVIIPTITQRVSLTDDTWQEMAEVMETLVSLKKVATWHRPKGYFTTL